LLKQLQALLRFGTAIRTFRRWFEAATIRAKVKSFKYCKVQQESKAILQVRQLTVAFRGSLILLKDYVERKQEAYEGEFSAF